MFFLASILPRVLPDLGVGDAGALYLLLAAIGMVRVPLAIARAAVPRRRLA